MNKKFFLLGFLFLLTVVVIIGGVKYNKIMQVEKLAESEHKASQTETIQLLVDSLFKDEKKEELASDITEIKLKEVLNQVKKLPANLANEKILSDSNTANLFYKTQLKVKSLLNGRILSDDVSKEQIEEANTSLKKIESLSLPLYKKLSEKLTEANVQFDYNIETNKVLTDLFEKKDKKVVKNDVTREQFEVVQKKVSAIKNKKIKEEQEELLKLVEKQLIKQEQKVLEKQLLEEERLEEERLKEEKLKEEKLEEELKEDPGQSTQDNTEVREENSANTSDGEEYKSTWKPEPAKPWKPEPAKPWKPEPAKPWKSSDNNNPSTEEKPVPEVSPEPEVTPDSTSEDNIDQNSDKEANPEEEPKPIPEPGVESESYN